MLVDSRGGGETCKSWSYWVSLRQKLHDKTTPLCYISVGILKIHVLLWCMRLGNSHKPVTQTLHAKPTSDKTPCECDKHHHFHQYTSVNWMNWMNMLSTVLHFLQGVSVACYAEPCIRYGRVVRPSVSLSVTLWHWVKTTQAKITKFVTTHSSRTSLGGKKFVQKFERVHHERGR